MLNEVRDRKTNILSHLYVESKKHDTKELTYKTGTDSQTQKMNLWLQGGRVWGGTDLEYGTDTHILLYLKWTTNKDLVYSTKNTAQYYITI